MAGVNKTQIFIVDDDRCILDSIAVHLRRAGYDCTCFINPDDCLKHLMTATCDLLITDVKMPDKDGIELVAEVKQTAPWIPVIVMTSYANIPMSVKAVKAGAFDFVEKPLDSQILLTTIELALKKNDLPNILKGKNLTKTEMTVLHLILQGRSNKNISQILHRSVRTIEVHRSHIMHKLNVDNVVDLVKRVSDMGLDDTI